MPLDQYVTKIEKVLQKRTVSIIVFLVVLGIGLVVRLMFAGMAQHPGHGDRSFYYTLAENILEGRGFQIDYIWHYLGRPESITHSSNDYWMPFTSIIISSAQFVFGKSLFAALLPSILAGLLLSVFVYCWCNIYSESRFVALCSASLVLFLPSLFRFSLLTDSTIYYALFVSLSLFFMIQTRLHPAFSLLSSALAGLAHLTRQDGLLLVPFLMAVLLLSRRDWRIKLGYMCLALGVYLVVLSPLLITNYQTFGAFMPAGPSKTMFLTAYEDLYSYSKALTLHSYLDWGFSNIVQSKVRSALLNIRTLYELVASDFLGVFLIVGTLHLATSAELRHKREIYVLPLLFLILLFLFYTLIATFPGERGGFMRSGMALTPFLVVIAVETVHRTIPSRSVVFIGLLLSLSLLFVESIQVARRSINFNTHKGERLAAMKEIVASDARRQGYGNDIVIMTREPWEVYHSTKYKAIQVPSENLDVIHQVAKKFGANYLLLPARRKALEPLFWGQLQDPRFEFLAEIPKSRMKIFRIRAERE